MNSPLYVAVGHPILFVLIIPGAVLSLVLHEWAHAWAAVGMGDPKPRAFGRLSLDPRRHLDVLGTLMVAFFGFGWGKPVPVQSHRLRHRVWGEVAVYGAGIAMNLLLAVLFAVLVRLSSGHLATAWSTLHGLNIILAAFNFLPLPPLDGWRVLLRLFPRIPFTPAGRFLEQFGMLVLVLLLALAPRLVISLLSPLVQLVAALANGAARALLGLLG